MWFAVTRSEVMGYLLQGRGEVAGDLPAQPRREAAPDLAGLDRHGATASPATVSRSRNASALSLGGTNSRSGCASRFVAARGSVRTHPDPKATRTLATGRPA